jgi:putative acetyltransferase
LVAIIDKRAVGHILFSKAYISSNPDLNVSILAPLAVLPEYQRQGIGTKLVKKGIQILSKVGVDLVFVAGHPDYYPRHGFTPAGILGFEAPFPIPEKYSNAWMVKELSSGIIKAVSGKVVCCEVLNKPEHWRDD